jgi:hypothetical protein
VALEGAPIAIAIASFCVSVSLWTVVGVCRVPSFSQSPLNPNYSCRSPPNAQAQKMQERSRQRKERGRNNNNEVFKVATGISAFALEWSDFAAQEITETHSDLGVQGNPATREPHSSTVCVISPLRRHIPSFCRRHRGTLVD